MVPSIDNSAAHWLHRTDNALQADERRAMAARLSDMRPCRG